MKKLQKLLQKLVKKQLKYQIVHVIISVGALVSTDFRYNATNKITTLVDSRMVPLLKVDGLYKQAEDINQWRY